MKKLFLFMSISILALISCNKNDVNSPELKAWESEVNQLKKATEKYVDFNTAVSEGWIDVSGYVPNMGHHFLNPAYSDGVFELEKPEVILYLPDENGAMKMVAVEYSIIPKDPENPGNPPEGFTGALDEWHFNEELKQWQLHVWTKLENPDGIFAPFNPAIGD